MIKVIIGYRRPPCATKPLIAAHHLEANEQEAKKMFGVLRGRK